MSTRNEIHLPAIILQPTTAEIGDTNGFRKRSRTGFLLAEHAFAAVMVLGYESHLHERFFPYLNLLAVIAFLLFLAIVSRRPKGASAYGVLILCALPFILALSSVTLRGVLGYEVTAATALKPGLQACIVLLVLRFYTRFRAIRFFDALVRVCTPLAVISFLVLARGQLGVWELHGGRSSSVFHDPNYAGALFGFCAVWSLVRFRHSHRLSYLLRPFLFSAATFVTYSKGSLIALAAGLLIHTWKINKGHLARAALVLTMATLLSWLPQIDFLGTLGDYFPYLRINQGLNYRDLFWKRALSSILEHPLTGHDQTALSQITFVVGREYASIHNYYLETAFLYGVPSLLTICVLIGSSFLALARTPFLPALVYLVVAANNFTISIGGVGPLPFLFTLVTLLPFLYETVCPSQAAAFCQKPWQLQ